MGLTNSSTGKGAADSEKLLLQKDGWLLALAGNPNVGKSTVFNALTGMNQHTGNWTGKTVSTAAGQCSFHDKSYTLVDLPGTYSLMAHSAEEEVARDFICFGPMPSEDGLGDRRPPDAVIVVCDATCLERNLNLVLQCIEITPKTLVCVNLLDEARKKHITVDLELLEKRLGVPVVGVTARSGQGLDALMERTEALCEGPPPDPVAIALGETSGRAADLVRPALESLLDREDCPPLPSHFSRWASVRIAAEEEGLLSVMERYLGFPLESEELQKAREQAGLLLAEEGLTVQDIRDDAVTSLIRQGEKIASECVDFSEKDAILRDRRLDRILTNRWLGVPIMLLLLAVIFWLTIVGANYPSEMLSTGLFWVGERLRDGMMALHSPGWLTGAVVDGVYRVLAWVVSVMLPPMAIFFPLFTLLEDSGYLPRVAFNLDKHFQKAKACGKQALTMCMGFGCNAAGVVGCRIIDSPRERLIAILTNNFVPCNGRFPTIISIITMFFAAGIGFSAGRSLVSALLLTGVILLGIIATFLVSRLLSGTVLKGVPSSFTLELPPYRRPQIGKVLVRSIVDRTLFVLGRAVVVAAPAGLIIWLLANIHVDGATLLSQCASFLDPAGRFLGMDGVILLAFLLGFPANEIVIPIMLMAYLSTGALVEAGSLMELKALLVSNGWTWVTALCVMLFSLLHFPCSTTCLTIKKETGSMKWTALAFALPTIVGIVVCAIVGNIGKLFL